MHDCKVIMKDGRKFSGPLWDWRPVEGWFSIPSDENAPEKIFLRDVASAVNHGLRTGIGKIEDVDLLERARKNGWDGR
jgi:hypothetical protein